MKFDTKQEHIQRPQIIIKGEDKTDLISVKKGYPQCSHKFLSII